MISTPYATLRESLGMPDDWQPDWAEHLEVRRHEEQTVYVAQPDRIDAAGLDELYKLSEIGWNITIDSQRLNRIRINLWQ